jgi:diguanylate cyclase (GGDEF)-like protein
VFKGEGMISLKRYLDQEIRQMAGGQPEGSGCETLLNAYRTCLVEMGDCGVNACPDLAPELARGLKRIIEALEQSLTADSITASEYAVRDLLRSWGRQVAGHYDQKATDVRDLLLVMSRTTESLGSKDDRVAQRIDKVAEQLRSIVSLDDVSRIRASVEASARELRESLDKMSAEGKALIGHLRAEVSTYQAKLEKAERVSCTDALTGLGSRHWVESRIQERIGCDARFSIALIDISGFHHVVESYGNLTGDLLLKEFARELRSACRFTDIVGRWGSDEFIIVLDDAGPESRPQVARLRASISKSYHVPGRTGYVKVALAVSVGMAEYRLGEGVQEILERADEELCRERSTKLQQRTA